MFLRCYCGYVLTNVNSPNPIEHLLLNAKSIEKMQDISDAEVAKHGVIEMWPENWEAAGGTNIWHCFKCNRLYIGVEGKNDEILVYKYERTGIPQSATGIDTEFLPEEELLEYVRKEQAGESIFKYKGPE